MGDKLGEELLNAARTGDVEAVQCCVEKGKLFRRCSQYKRGLNRAFQEAVFVNNVKVVEELLLVEGVGINTKGAGGFTPLMLAAQRGHGECVELLLRHGADADIKEWQGCNARDLAEKNGHTAVSQLFCRNVAVKPPLQQRLSLPNTNLGSSQSNLTHRVAVLENKQNVTTTKVSDLEVRCGDLETSQGQLEAALKDVKAQITELYTQGSREGKPKKNQGPSGGALLYDRIRSHYQTFESDLTATDHLAFLFQREVIEIQDMEEIEAKAGRQKQNQALMRKLMGKPDKRWVYAFKQSLDEDPGSTHLAVLLND